MNKVSIEQFSRDLEALIRPIDRVILIQSRLAAFGHLLEGPIDTLVSRLLAAIEAVAGPDRTVVLPSFTFRFGRTRLYDPERSRPETGVLVEYAWKSGRYKRTPRPMNNYLVRGPHEDDILRLKSETAWGDDSILAWFANVNARTLTLGIPQQDNGWIVIHRAEQIAQVPYRYFKRLKGALELNGVPAGGCEEVMFVRPLKVPCLQNNAPVNVVLEQRNLITPGRDPRFGMRSVNCGDVVETAVAMLKDDPYSFVENRAELADWERDGKAQELAELKPDERWGS